MPIIKYCNHQVGLIPQSAMTSYEASNASKTNRHPVCPVWREIQILAWLKILQEGQSKCIHASQARLAGLQPSYQLQNHQLTMATPSHQFTPQAISIASQLTSPHLHLLLGKLPTVGLLSTETSSYGPSTGCHPPLLLLLFPKLFSAVIRLQVQGTLHMKMLPRSGSSGPLD